MHIQSLLLFVRMSRIICWLVMAITLVCLGGCHHRETQPKRVGILVGIDTYETTAQSFVAAMTELGYRSGENITYDIHMVHGDEVQMKAIAEQFVQQSVDLILTVTHKAALYAKEAAAGKNIPVVFSVAIAQDKRLLHDLREPGGNVTGVRYPLPDMTLKKLEYMLELIPDGKSILVPFKENYPAALLVLAALRPFAEEEGVSIIELPVESPAGLAEQLERLVREEVPVDGVMVLPEPILNGKQGWKQIREFAAQRKIPLAGINASLALPDSVFTYNPDPVTMGRLAAPLADQILRGTPAGTIPVISPEVELRVNYAVCRKLGLDVPEGMLKMAADVIR